MRYSVPHPIPYQGSKRRLAQAILSYIPTNDTGRLVEPFVGSGAVTLAAAKYKKFQRFLIADKLDPLTALWQSILDNPSGVADEYEALWWRERERPIDEYYEIRNEFNADHDPAKLLYLLARCVKNAVRFNPAGEFNQSPDKRRTGTQPKTMRNELVAVSAILRCKTDVECTDFLQLFQHSMRGDFFYLDPPYQGTSDGRDSRYIGGVTRERIIEGLRILNERGNSFILSYDGSCGDKTYGDRLPEELATRVLLDVGRSSQATLNGNNHTTIESLYISHNIAHAGAGDVVMFLSQYDAVKQLTGALF